MQDLQILEAVERYISGQMGPDERVYFEQLRKTNPEVDQAVVEHTFFLQQMNRFDEVRKLKNTLNETHVHLAEKGQIASPRPNGRARVVYLYNRYKRVAAIAASIAGITALTFSALIWSFSPGKPAKREDVAILKREFDNKFNEIRIANDTLNKKIEDVKSDQAALSPADIQYKSGGTGFLLDVKGYVVTNAHVVDRARHIAVQGSDGKEHSARLVYFDKDRDIAILRINSKNYKAPSSLPYSFKKNAASLAEPVFTLGYPRNEIVYGEGYVAAKTGYKGDSLALQITIVANHGNSGGPVLNQNGEVVGILTGKQTSAEGAVFALHSKYIHHALTELQKDSSHKDIRLPSTSSLKGKERPQQAEIVSNYVFMVKVD